MKKAFLRQIHKNEEGGILIIFALSIFVLLMMIGGAVEFGEALLVKNKLGHAIDSAALAAAATPTGGDQTESAKRYYESNYSSAAGTEVSYDSLTVSGIGASKVTIVANAAINTSLLSLNGMDSIRVATKSVVQAKQKGAKPDLDMVVVADASGSMSEYDRMDDLKAALASIIDALNITSPAGNKNIRFGMSKFSQTLLAQYGLSSDKIAADLAINELIPDYSTCGACGLAGAVELFSSSPAPITSRADGNVYSANKSVIFMTDGMMNTMIDGRFGGEGWSGSPPVPKAELVDSTLVRAEVIAECQKLKDLAVTVYTIGFSSDSQSPENSKMLKDCASDGKTGKLSYYAPTGEELKAIFKMIAGESSKIKILE